MAEVMDAIPDGARGSELRPRVEGVDFVPERVERDDHKRARALLERDGAVIFTGCPVEPDSTVNAAAAVLGTRLRELEKVQERTTENAEVLALHRDGAHVVVDVQQRAVQLRIPDPDYVFVLSVAPARAGGESVVVDGYRVVDQLENAAPELYEFLTTVDVDVTSAIPRADVYRMPKVCRMVEWTRGGRKLVRVAQHAQPAPRENHWEEHQTLINAYDTVLADIAEHVQGDTILAEGEMLVLDNYRCLHSARPHEGSRTVHILRCKSSDA